MTDAFAVIGIWGPRARDVLTAVTDDDVSGEALPFSHARAIAIGGAAVLAQRITFVGELGFELYVAPEWAVQVWDRSDGGGPARTASAPVATACSSRCGSRRATATSAPTSRPSDTPYEGGVGFCVAERQGRSSAPRRSPARARKVRATGCGRWSSATTPRTSRSTAARRCASTARRRPRAQRAYAFTVRRMVALAQCPPDLDVGARVDGRRSRRARPRRDRGDGALRPGERPYPRPGGHR